MVEVWNNELRHITYKAYAICINISCQLGGSKRDRSDLQVEEAPAAEAQVAARVLVFSRSFWSDLGLVPSSWPPKIREIWMQKIPVVIVSTLVGSPCGVTMVHQGKRPILGWSRCLEGLSGTLWRKPGWLQSRHGTNDVLQWIQRWNLCKPAAFFPNVGFRILGFGFCLGPQWWLVWIDCVVLWDVSPMPQASPQMLGYNRKAFPWYTGAAKQPERQTLSNEAQGSICQGWGKEIVWDSIVYYNMIWYNIIWYNMI